MSAFHLFALTAAVVFGIGLPIGCYALWQCLCRALADGVETMRLRAAYKNKRGPYTRCELVRVPNQQMLCVRLYKDDSLVYEIGADKP